MEYDFPKEGACEPIKMKDCWVRLERLQSTEDQSLRQVDDDDDAGSLTDFTLSVENTARKRRKQKEYSCLICKRVFLTKYNLKHHEYVHTGEKPYSCIICKKTFSFLGNLKVHEYTHTGEKRYSCEICKKKFVHASSLNAHSKIHTNVRAYNCELCQKKFKTLGALKRHKRIHLGLNLIRARCVKELY
ncbi:putative zinc finger protein 702 [Cydia pomonella]|uniref:putative zinc finger protein 702 n=1 Tax=Cydia pomonella TaxID=82600 RepID=UPI002ADD6721|nr:putative zinc finger protein 702 [Cydia pomonella]XP_061726490.1 putative zinc finger protein 702 [Cydia pomonella]XP_061726491.1 putative zinc finger protein 702 [Cydia pomonella]